MHVCMVPCNVEVHHWKSFHKLEKVWFLLNLYLSNFFWLMIVHWNSKDFFISLAMAFITLFFLFSLKECISQINGLRGKCALLILKFISSIYSSLNLLSAFFFAMADFEGGIENIWIFICSIILVGNSRIKPLNYKNAKKNSIGKSAF